MKIVSAFMLGICKALLDSCQKKFNEETALLGFSACYQRKDMLELKEAFGKLLNSPKHWI